MQTTKKFIFLGLLGALLIAGLFLFRQHSELSVVAIVKPSQLDFKQSNQLAETTVRATKPTEAAQVMTSSAQNLSAEDKSKWYIFENILKTKNDNDPRLDLDLKKLSKPMHLALYEKYHAIPAEDRNGKGLVAYLIAREISSVEDLQFLKKVYEEPPCLSLDDCKTTGPDEAHHSSENQTTLVYPQLNSLYQIERQLAQDPIKFNDPAFRNELVRLLVQAENFPVPAVQDKARAIRSKYRL